MRAWRREAEAANSNPSHMTRAPSPSPNPSPSPALALALPEPVTPNPNQVRVHDLVLPKVVRAPKRSSAVSKLAKNATEEDKEAAAAA